MLMATEQSVVEAGVELAHQETVAVLEIIAIEIFQLLELPVKDFRAGRG